MAVYKFGNVDNNNEEINGKRYRISRGSKDDGSKFRIKNQNERASLFMQFLILFNRNFKASIRNAVSYQCINFFWIIEMWKKCNTFIRSFWFTHVWSHTFVLRQCLDTCTIMSVLMLHTLLVITSISMDPSCLLFIPGKCLSCYRVSYALRGLCWRVIIWFFFIISVPLEMETLRR